MSRTYQDHTYAAPDQLPLYARLYSGDDSRTTLLCMHGLTRNSADFHAMLGALPDWPAISVDQRGRGRSAYDPDSSHYRPDVYCADMFAMLDDLGVDAVIAVGTSMGGIMAMMMAAQRPELFKAAIINDIGPVVDPKGLARLGSYVGQSMSFDSWDAAIASIRAQGPTIFPDFTDADWRAFAHNVCETTDDGRVQYRYDPAIAESLKNQDEGAVPPDLWPLFDALARVPTLIIRGETSDILSADTAAKMAARQDTVRLETIPNRGHAPTLTEPAAIAAITSFLESLA